MLLVLDEIVNVSPKNTILFNGSLWSLDSFTSELQQGGPQIFRQFQQASNVVLKPFAPSGATTDAPSYTRLLSMVGSNPQVFDASCMGIFPDGSDPGRSALFASSGTGAVSLQATHMAQSLSFLIVPETGAITALTYQILPFNGIGPGPGWPTDGTSGNNFQFPDASGQPGQLYNAALVTTIASVPDGADLEPFLRLSPVLAAPWMPPNWPVKTTRSVILPDQTTILTFDPNSQTLFPGAPLLRYGLYIGDAPYLKFHGTYDFSLAVQEYDASQQAKIDNAYFGTVTEIIQAAFFIGGFFAPGPLEGLALWGFENALESSPNWDPSSSIPS